MGDMMSDLFEYNDVPVQSLGGKARAEALPPERRREIAKTAAAARWGDGSPTLKATHGSDDHPIRIGEVEIPCYVLEDGTRVLSQRGVLGAFGIRYGSRAGGADRLTAFLSGRGISPHVSHDLLDLTNKPIKFSHPAGGNLAHGYPATILADICDAVLAARKAGVLQKQQLHIAEQAEILVRGFARVGIIALVDEATGYQEVRDRRALEEILNKYISEELRKWTKTFPDDYFHQIFRLKGWSVPKLKSARPGVIGSYTNDVVYARLAPGVLEELQRLNPAEKGRRKHKNFQFLTPDHGHPNLKEHLRDVILLMAAAGTWAEFKKLLDRVKPRVNTPGELPLSPEPSES